MKSGDINKVGISPERSFQFYSIDLIDVFAYENEMNFGLFTLSAILVILYTLNKIKWIITHRDKDLLNNEKFCDGF